ncbi:MAG: hypothetical protein K0S12_1776 [Bacteroidetes bacterium]|nr:hypothetical protein [Bacteroidota bacterium]
MVDQKKHTSGNKKRDLGILVAVIAIILLVNFIGTFYFKRFDLTSEKRYTLAESTKTLLGSLKDEILFKVYLSGNFNPDFTRLQNETKEMLDQFHTYSNGNVQYEFITPGEGKTPAEKDALEKELKEKGLTPEQVIEKRTDKQLETKVWPGAIVSYSTSSVPWQIFKRQLGFSLTESVNKSIEDMEYSLVSTIKRSLQGKKKEITFVEGHYELDTLHQYDFMASLSEYYNVNRTPINGKLRAFEGSDAIVITQPDSSFNQKDKFIIDQYIMNGGKVLWLIDPVGINRDTFQMKGYTLGLSRELGIEELLFKYGVRLNPVLVQDFQCAKAPINVSFKKDMPDWKDFPWVYSPLIMPDGNHPIVRNLDLIRLEFASTLDTVTAKGIKKTILLRTSRNSKTQPTPARIFLGSALYPMRESQFNTPYLPVACLLEGEFHSFAENKYFPDTLIKEKNLFKFVSKGKNTKMIVVADGDIARNIWLRERGKPLPLGYDYYTGMEFANRNFLLNCVNYLLDDEGLLQLRSREVKLRQLDKKKITLHRNKWQTINVVVPLILIIALGMFQFWIRKRKYTK